MKYLIILYYILITTVPLFSQGSLSGKILDSKTNEVLIGANVSLVGTTLGSSTDIDGYYFIKNINPGVYQLRISYVSYKNLLINEIKIENGKELQLNISLEPSTQQLEEIVVSAEANKNSEAGVLKVQRNSSNIVDALSSELISKNNSSDGTDVLKRMSGITINDGKYAVIRGVGDRYNNTTLNGANVPSSDPEKKSFSYDIIPASLIENVITSKTFSPDKPADFTGGLVQISTVEFPQKFIFSLDASAGYLTSSTNEEYITYNTGSKDWLGFDDGTRGMPSIIGSEKITRNIYSDSAIMNIGRSFKNNWSTSKTSAPINQSYKLALGDKFTFGDNTLGIVASATYTNNYDSKEVERASYNFEGPRYNYKGNVYSNSVSLGSILNLSYKFEQKHKISFKNMFNQNADDEVSQFNGIYTYGEQYRNETGIKYVARSLFSSQLIGEHQINFLNGLTFNWSGSYSKIKRDEPDGRRYIYQKSIYDEETPFTFLVDQGLLTRFYGKLDDNAYGANFNIAIKPFENPFMPTIKTGFAIDKKDRMFTARNFGFRDRFKDFNVNRDELFQQSPDQIFNEVNINPEFIEIAEITKPSDSYSSNQDVYAAFLMFDANLFEVFRIVTGLRYEHSKQNLNSFNSTNQPINISPEYNDVLPSLNVTYMAFDNFNIRFAYNKTLARPEFRELAPFSYFDFSAQDLIEGNPELKRTIINNYDLRFELYPQGNELVALSLFYKDFIDPIEQVYQAASSVEPIRTFDNTNGAKTWGVELELRRNLSFAGLPNFSFAGNLSLIKSEIDIASSGFQASKRPLQGQAEYIFNLGMYYDNYNSGFSTSLTYNKVGEKIAKVGFSGLGNFVERPRDQIDFSISQNFFSVLRAKFSVKDILAQDQLVIQKMSDGDKISYREKRGRTLSLTLGYNF